MLWFEVGTDLNRNDLSVPTTQVETTQMSAHSMFFYREQD